jgi:hypothetical protein
MRSDYDGYKAARHDSSREVSVTGVVASRSSISFFSICHNYRSRNPSILFDICRLKIDGIIMQKQFDL